MVTIEQLHARFDALVFPEPMSGCWLWTGPLSYNGYGLLAIWNGKASRNIRAHRFNWERAHGPIPPGMHACHRCDVRSCCNPDHIFIGTHADNMQDAVRKGRTSQGAAHRAIIRRVAARGSRNGKALLTEADIPIIRQRLAAGEVARVIAADFGVSPPTISDVKTGRKWSHV